MNTELIRDDFQWLEIQYSTRMEDLKECQTVDDWKACMADLRDIHALMSQKAVIWREIESRERETEKERSKASDDARRTQLEFEKLEFEKEKLIFEREKFDLEKEKVELEERKVKLEERKADIEVQRIEADLHISEQRTEVDREKISAERPRRVDMTAIIKAGCSLLSVFMIAFTEMKANGFLDEKLLRRAERLGD